MCLPSHRNIHKRKEMKWLLKWFGRFCFLLYLWGARHLLLAAFKADEDCWASHKLFFFFISTFPFAIWRLIILILYWKGKYIFFKVRNTGTWYKFWYNQLFLSSTYIGVALSVVSQTTHPATATEDATCLRQLFFLSHYWFFILRL